MGIQAEYNKDGSIIFVDQKEWIGIQAAAFNDLIQESINRVSKNISVDLSKVQFISSLGIGLLVHAYTTCMKRNIKFNLQGVNAHIMKVLYQVKLAEIFNIV
jgi:anti-anti-sigma factor